MTRKQLEQRAAIKGYALHESVTDDRLCRINPKMLNGNPKLIDKHDARYLDASKEQIASWIEAGCRIASYDLGGIDEEVISPPTTIYDLMLVVLPSFRIVAKCNGVGECDDGDNIKTIGLTYTILI